MFPADAIHPVGHPGAVGLLHGRVGVVHVGARLGMQRPGGIGCEGKPPRHVLDVGATSPAEKQFDKNISIPYKSVD